MDKSKLKLLQLEWYTRLRNAGFRDIEDQRGNLKNYDRRTIAFDNRDEIAQFFRRLDHFLTQSTELPTEHFKILTLYARGVFIKTIAKECGRHRCTVMDIIKRYKKMI